MSRSTGGTGDYVEGERVFAPPQGSFDPDWVACLAAERLPGAPDRARLEQAARAAWAAWSELRTGADPAHVQELLPGLTSEEAAAVVGAVRDFAAAYDVG